MAKKGKAGKGVDLAATPVLLATVDFLILFRKVSGNGLVAGLKRWFKDSSSWRVHMGNDILRLLWWRFC